MYTEREYTPREETFINLFLLYDAKKINVLSENRLIKWAIHIPYFILVFYFAKTTFAQDSLLFLLTPLAAIFMYIPIFIVSWLLKRAKLSDLDIKKIEDYYDTLRFKDKQIIGEYIKKRPALIGRNFKYRDNKIKGYEISYFLDNIAKYTTVDEEYLENFDHLTSTMEYQVLDFLVTEGDERLDKLALVKETNNVSDDEIANIAERLAKDL